MANVSVKTTSVATGDEYESNSRRRTGDGHHAVLHVGISDLPE